MNNASKCAIALLLTGTGILGSVTGHAQTQTVAAKKVGTITITTNPVVPAPGVATVVNVTLPVADASGFVALLDGNEVVGSAPVMSGSATITLTAEKAPTHPLVAVYSGDKTYAAATTAATASPAEQVTFGSNGQAPLVIATAPTPGHESEFATYTVKVPDPAAKGIVLFVLDGSLVGSGTINNGVVTVVRGIGSMHIVYTGDDRHTPVLL
jgi:hypothetical protein